MASIRAAVALLMVVAGLAVANPASGQTFSDNVNVIVRANGILDIIGDNGDNRVTLCQNPDDLEEFSVIIITDGNTFRTEVANGVTKDVRFNMRGGNDIVQINGNTRPPVDCDDIYPPPPPPTTTTTAPTTTTTEPPPPTTPTTPVTTAPTTTTTEPPPPTTPVPTAPPTTPPTTDVPPGLPVSANNVCGNGGHECHHDPEMLFPRDLRILLGSGRSSVSGYEFGVVDDLTIRGGSGYDEVSLRYVNVWDRADINVLSGGSFVGIASSYFGRSSIRSSTGVDNFNINSTDLGNRPIITTGSSDDGIFGNEIAAQGRFTINTGGGADGLSLFGDGCHGACAGDDHEGRPYQLNVIMGAQDDNTTVGFELLQGDRLNGGSGNGDSLFTENVANVNATGGPTINGYEFIGPIFGDD